MPIIVTATGPGSLPSSQAEVDERRAARIATRATIGCISKRAKKASKKSTNGDEVCVGEKLWSAIERRIIKIVPPSSPEWPDPPPDIHVVLPGTKGHVAYIFKVKDRLKAAGFRWNAENKLWYREGLQGVPPGGWC